MKGNFKLPQKCRGVGGSSMALGLFPSPETEYRAAPRGKRSVPGAAPRGEGACLGLIR